jgi:hypothetical protein
VRRIVLSLLMMAVLLPSAAFARIAYLCSMDGKVRSSCCCPTKAKEREADPLTSIKAACCCAVSKVAPAKTAATNPPKANADFETPVVAILTVAPAALPRHRVATFAPRSHAPPDSPDRSLFASQCALLL